VTCPWEGEWVVIMAMNQAAEVLAELPGERVEVEPERSLGSLELEGAREVYDLRALRRSSCMNETQSREGLSSRVIRPAVHRKGREEFPCLGRAFMTGVL
jgi:hypothetical protein